MNINMETIKRRVFNKWIASFDTDPRQSKQYYSLYKSLEQLEDQDKAMKDAVTQAQRTKSKADKLLNSLLDLDRFLNELRTRKKL